jgi:hypothetical protein
MDQFKQQLTKEVDTAVSKFRKGVDKIKNSPNPYYSDVEVQNYEIGKLKADLESQVAEINAKYKEKAEELLANAERQAATSYFKPSMSDKEFVGSVLDDFTASIALAYSDSDKAKAFSALEARFEHMTPEQLYAVKSKLPSVLQAVKDDEFSVKQLRGVNSTLSNLRTHEQESLDEAKALELSSPDGAFRRLKMTHPSYSHLQKSRPVKTTDVR